MNTSGSYHGAVGGKVKLKKHTGGKSGGSQKLPGGLSQRMKAGKAEQQSFPGMWLSAYGRRRKSKMKGL